MLTISQWNALLYLKPSDFKKPDGLEYSIVKNLDRFIGIVGSMPVILSDFRVNDPKTHGKGIAIDTTWPGIEPIEILELAESQRMFGGIGVYINEADAVSFHFDTRPFKANGEPARWGGIITHPYDNDSGDHIRRTEYVGMSLVTDLIKKKEVGLIILLLLSGLLLWKSTNR